LVIGLYSNAWVMSKRYFYLIFAFLVFSAVHISAQENTTKKELIMERDDLIDALQRISSAVWEIESQKAHPRVSELALQYRLDRLENMISGLSVYLGLNPATIGGQNIIIDRTQNVPVQSYYPQQLPSVTEHRYVDRTRRYSNNDWQRQLQLVQQQLGLLSDSLQNDSLQSQIQLLSLQIDSLRQLSNVVIPEVVVPPIIELVRDSTAVKKETAKPDFERFKSQVFFAVSSTTLTNEGKKTLDEIISIMKRNSGLFATVSGSSSREGNAVYNENLSRKRAESVQNYLKDAGIGLERIILKSAGIDKESDLLIYGRRVDIVVEP